MKYPKLIATLLCIVVFLALLIPLSVFAAEKEEFTLRVGYFPNYGIAQDENGRLSGYIKDYMTEVARINRWNVEYIACDWAEGVEKLEKGEVDVFGGMQKTPERERSFDFSDYPMGYEYGSLFVSEDNKEIFYNDLESINGKTVGISSNNYYEQQLSQFCKENGILLNVTIIDDNDLQGRMLQNGEIDLRVSGSLLMPPNTKVALQFSTNTFYFPTTKGNTFVLDGMNRALKEIQGKDTYFSMRLYDKYYSEPALGKKAFTADEQQFISTAPVLKVGYEAKFSPIEYHDEKNNVAKGIVIDLIEKVSEHSGLQFELVPIQSRSQAIQMMADGQIDMISDFVADQSTAEMDGLVLSDPIFKTNLTFIGKQGHDFTAKGSILAIPDEWSDVEHKVLQSYPSFQVKYYNTMEECLNAILQDEADVAVQNTLAADTMLKPMQYRKLSANSMRDGELDICLGISAEAPESFLLILNKSIASISLDTINQAVYTHTIGTPYEPSMVEKLRYNALLLLAVALVFFLTLYLYSVYVRKRLNRIAFYDRLTGEMNLNKFNMEARKILSHMKEPYVVIVIDIDKFKSINDMYGYDFGDQMLQFLAKNLRESVDDSAIICRGTADRFHILVKYVDHERIEKAFEAFARSVESFRASDTLTCKINLSGGACIIDTAGINIISMIDRANIAAKTVKNSHESHIAFYNQSMYDQINNEKEIENRMVNALAANEFMVYLQPKIELSSMSIVGAEALIRWCHPEKGLIMPNLFIPLFEKNGFIVDIDYFVFEQVCKMLNRWKRENRPMFTISVNLSRRHIQNSDTAQVLANILHKYDVEAKYIEIELTESAFVDCDVSTITDLLDMLHCHGFTVSVDDFGSGYSSLSLLKEIPIDVLKIDRSFFTSGQSTKAEMLLESVISLSRKMKIKTVSEGVETKEQVLLLIQLGCDLVQGFYFAKPMPIETLEQVLDSKENGVYDFTQL